MVMFGSQASKVYFKDKARGGSRTAAISKMKGFVLCIITKRSILDVAAALDPPLKATKKI